MMVRRYTAVQEPERVIAAREAIGVRGARRSARASAGARGGIRSVIDPSTISAENATVSDRVGCGCTVSAMSVALAPISSASTVSEIRSPALDADDSGAEHPL